MDYKSILKEMMEPESNDSVMEIQVGDVINLKSWFSDIWSEVLWVGIDYVTHCMYSKYGDERWKLLTPIENIRKVATKDAVNPAGATFHMANGKFGMYGRAWPTPLTSDTRAHSNHPEYHPDGFKGRPE